MTAYKYTRKINFTLQSNDVLELQKIVRQILSMKSNEEFKEDKSKYVCINKSIEQLEVANDEIETAKTQASPKISDYTIK